MRQTVLILAVDAMPRDRHGKQEGPWDKTIKEGFLFRMFGNPKNAPKGVAGSGPDERRPARGWGLVRGRTRKPPKGGGNPFLSKPKKPPGAKGSSPWDKKPPKPKGGWDR
jgi:hypothetical protein